MISLKKDHTYYFQVMGQLRITGRNMCYFIIHTSNWTHFEQIFFDVDFWNQRMVKKLQL